jgi:hypothetical protein
VAIRKTARCRAHLVAEKARVMIASCLSLLEYGVRLSQWFDIPPSFSSFDTTTAAARRIAGAA